MKHATYLLIGLSSLMAAGCRTGSHADNGSLVGSGLGAATGAIIGHQSGHTGTGAILGAAAGAIAGGLIGDARDAEEADQAAMMQAEQAALQAMTNFDLIKMTQAGVSDELIISTVRDRGGRFDLSPDQVISLKQSGVSERVLQSVQGMRSGVSPATHVVPQAGYAPPTIVMPPPGVVVVPPRVGVGVIVGPRPRYHSPRRHGHFHARYGW